MKFFYWNLSEKEKFIRSLWTGILVLILLYIGCGLVEGSIFVKIVMPIVLTLIYLLDLIFLYRKWKKSERGDN